MHDGCSGSFNDGIEVVEKLRMMGFSSQPMPVPALPAGAAGRR